jgi:hypothetical protein
VQVLLDVTVLVLEVGVGQGGWEYVTTTHASWHLENPVNYTIPFPFP